MNDGSTEAVRRRRVLAIILKQNPTFGPFEIANDSHWEWEVPDFEEVAAVCAKLKIKANLPPRAKRMEVANQRARYAKRAARWQRLQQSWAILDQRVRKLSGQQLIVVICCLMVPALIVYALVGPKESNSDQVGQVSSVQAVARPSSTPVATRVAKPVATPAQTAENAKIREWWATVKQFDFHKRPTLSSLKQAFGEPAYIDSEVLGTPSEPEYGWFLVDGIDVTGFQCQRALVQAGIKDGKVSDIGLNRPDFSGGGRPVFRFDFIASMLEGLDIWRVTAENGVIDTRTADEYLKASGIPNP